MKARGKKSGRRVGRRIENKRVRQAERQALEGGHVREIRSDSWAHRIEQPPLTDEASTRYPSQVAPKERPPKEKQPNPCKGGHQFLEDTEVVPATWYREPYVRHFKLCAECGEEREIDSWKYKADKSRQRFFKGYQLSFWLWDRITGRK